MKVFLDTNVLVSASAARGLCADLMRLVLAESEVLFGEVNVAEVRRVLAKRFKATEAQVNRIEALLRDQIVVPKPAERLPIAVRDADDAWVLASAVAGHADMLVSGDQDLLVLAPHAPLPIMSPREARRRLRGEATP